MCMLSLFLYTLSAPLRNRIKEVWKYGSMHCVCYIYFLVASSNTSSSSSPFISVFELHCTRLSALFAGIQPLCALTRTPPGTVHSFHFCKWGKCSLPQLYNYCSSLLNIIWRCIKPRARGGQKARRRQPRVPVKHRCYLESQVKMASFLWQNYTLWNKNMAFSPSSSSFVMVIVFPLPALTTGKRWEEREIGIKKEVTSG